LARNSPLSGFSGRIQRGLPPANQMIATPTLDVVVVPTLELQMKQNTGRSKWLAFIKPQKLFRLISFFPPVDFLIEWKPTIWVDPISRISACQKKETKRKKEND
jgi:hypothetical protein